MTSLHTLSAQQTALQNQSISSEALVSQALEHARASQHVFIQLDAAAALEHAKAVDLARQRQQPLPPYAGIPLSLKDLFDVAHQTTRAGSTVLSNAEPAACDATVVARLRAAGFVFLGRVNMSEFAFSGMGINPHYGTPLSVWDRATGRLPGGSSSGSAVSVAEGIVAGSIGSDTAGSCRIPAAFNGIVGFKPSYGRLPLSGAYPLSPTTDAPGPLANSVDCCARLDAIMAGIADTPLPEQRLDQLRLLIPKAQVMENLDPVVANTFSSSVSRLSQLGVQISEQALPQLDELLGLFMNTPLAAYEAQQAHRQRLQSHGDAYDPFVRWRLSGGAQLTRRDYDKTLKTRAVLATKLQQCLEPFDALIYPTVMTPPPSIASTADFEAARQVNFRCLRNTATVNYFDGCAISLPCHQSGEPPVGLMLSAGNGQDRKLLALAKCVEAALKR